MSSSLVFIVIIFVMIKYLSINIFASHDVKIFDHDQINLSNNNNNNDNNSNYNNNGDDNNNTYNNNNSKYNNNYYDNNYTYNVKINVFSTIDSAANVSLCDHTNSHSYSNYISTLNSNCNFRSAWELCHTLNLNIHCQINLPIKSTILMNMSYGSLILKSGMVSY